MLLDQQTICNVEPIRFLDVALRKFEDSAEFARHLFLSEHCSFVAKLVHFGEANGREVVHHHGHGIGVHVRDGAHLQFLAAHRLDGPNHHRLSGHGQFGAHGLCLLGETLVFAVLQAHACTKFHRALRGHAREFGPGLGAADGVKVTGHNSLDCGAFRGICAGDAHASKRVVLVDAIACVKGAQVFQDVGRTHHANVEVVGLQHVFGHALNVLDGDSVQALQVGLVVVFWQVVALDVECKPGHCAFIFERTGKASGEESLGGGEFCAVHLFVANAVDFCHELHQRAVRDFRPHIGIGDELGRDGIGTQRAACAIGERLVFAQVLHESSTECTATEDGVHQLDGRGVRVARREGHRLGDVDRALHGTFHRGKSHLVPSGELGGHDSRVRNVAAVPLAEVGIGFGVRLIRGDVTHHNEVGCVGTEVRLVILHQILAADVFQRFFGHDLTVGVKASKVGCRNEVARNLTR